MCMFVNKLILFCFHSMKFIPLNKLVSNKLFVKSVFHSLKRIFIFTELFKQQCKFISS